MLFVILIFLIYKLFFLERFTLFKRKSLPKICLFINSENPKAILRILALQSYPKNLFDVYINSNESFNFKFNVFEYNLDTIKNNNYDLISIVDSIIDINYLYYTANDYLEGYDIITGTSHYNISIILVKQCYNIFFNNKICESSFSFIPSLLTTDVKLCDTITLKRILLQNTNKINVNTNIKILDETDIFNDFTFKINPLSKGKFYCKLYFILISLLIIFITNNTIYLLILSYILLCISNMYFLYKNHEIKIIPVIFLPLNFIVLFIKSLLFRFNNKRSNIKPV